MSKRIWKFTLERQPGSQYLNAEVRYEEVLSFGLDPKGNLCVWCVVMPECRGFKKIHLALTGGPPPSEGRFIGTCLDGEHIIHCWDME